jgi:tetratricopeptide (TPR) repeat protein
MALDRGPYGRARRWVVGALASLTTLLVTALAMATDVGTDLLPSHWKWSHNAVVMWTIIGVLTVGITVLAVVQHQLAEHAHGGRPTAPTVLRQRLTRMSGGTVIGVSTGPVFTGMVITGMAPADLAIAAPSSNLPPRNPDFVGREMLVARARRRLAGRTGVVALYGMGGIGKSQLALEVAYRGRAEDEYEITWWVRAESVVTMAEDLARLAPTVSAPVGIDQDTTVAAVRMALGSRTRWLLIFDNAPSADAIAPWLPGGDGHILITSRDKGWGGLAERVEVGGFTRAESLSYLRRRADGEQRDAENLADALGDLPLALAQAASHLDLYGLSIAGYLRLYREREGPSLLLTAGLAGYPHSVATTWLIHFEELAAGEPASLELLRLCGHLNPDSINLDLFHAAPSALDGPMTRQLARTAANTVSWERAVGALVRTSLVTRLDDRHIRIHRLVSQVTRHQLAAAGDDTDRRWAQNCVRMVALVAQVPSADHETWESVEDLLPHVLQCIRWIDDFKLSDPASITLARRTGQYLVRVSRFAEAERPLTLAREITERHYGTGHPETARILNALAAFHHARAEYPQAEALYMDALSIRGRRSVRRGDLDTAQTLNDLGWLYRKQGRYTAALPLFQRALSIRERLLGAEDPTVAHTVNDLGCLVEEMGRYADAEQLYLRALHTRRRLLDADHPDTATSLWDLGWVYRRIGDYPKAENYFRQALDIRRRILGDNSLDTAMSCCDLAWVLLRTGRSSDARALLWESLTTRQELVGNGHPETAMSLHEMAFLAEADGDFTQARQMYERALAIREDSLGRDHPDTAATINALGHLYAAQGDVPRAATMFKRALSIHENLTDIVHPDRPTILYNMAGVCAADGSPEEALALLGRALDAAASLRLDPDHPQIAPITHLQEQLIQYRPNIKRKYREAVDPRLPK